MEVDDEPGQRQQSPSVASSSRTKSPTNSGEGNDVQQRQCGGGDGNSDDYKDNIEIYNPLHSGRIEPHANNDIPADEYSSMANLPLR